MQISLLPLLLFGIPNFELWSLSSSLDASRIEFKQELRKFLVVYAY